MSKLMFWYEFASTYSYLSAMRIEALAKAKGVTVSWRPFLLGPIFAAQGWDTSPFVIYPAKGKNMWRDMERKTARYGLSFSKPDLSRDGNWPRSSVKAARLALVGHDQGWGVRFSKAVYEDEFGKHADISQDDLLARLITEVGGDAAKAFSAATRDEYRGKLRANTSEAIELGIFGAPSFTVGEELFWGDDRLEDALDWAVAHG